MKKEFVAKTVEEAKAQAAEYFGVSEDKITFSVIEEPKKGLFGKTKGDAKLTGEYEMTKPERAAAYIKGILKEMKIEGEVTATENTGETAGALVEIAGDDTGAIIGRRGETLDALQYLTSMSVNRGDREYYRITLDSCGYREKRKAILEDLAIKISKTVIRTGRTAPLEPMNPYERRIIHSTVSTIEGVISKSLGEEPFRKVVISPKNPRFQRREGFRADSRPDNRGPVRDGKESRDRNSRDFRPSAPSGGGYNRDRRRNDDLPKKSIDMMKSSFEREYKKPKPEDSEIKGDLYGKIDI